MLKITSRKDNKLYLESGKLELFTPQGYLGSATTINGHKVDAIGLAPYKFYEKSTDKKPSKVGVMKRPSKVTFYPADIDQNVKDSIWTGVYDYSNENEYMKLTFEAGDAICDNFGIKHLNNVVQFTDLLLNGRLDNNIPYQYLASAWITNMVSNKVSLGVPGTVVGMVIREICRSINNRAVRFSNVIGKNPKVSPVAYQFANIREICANDSVFAALSFEDMNSMLDSSLNMTLRGEEQNISPVEQIIKM